MIVQLELTIDELVILRQCVEEVYYNRCRDKEVYKRESESVYRTQESRDNFIERAKSLERPISQLYDLTVKLNS